MILVVAKTNSKPGQDLAQRVDSPTPRQPSPWPLLSAKACCHANFERPSKLRPLRGVALRRTGHWPLPHAAGYVLPPMLYRGSLRVAARASHNPPSRASVGRQGTSYKSPKLSRGVERWARRPCGYMKSAWRNALLVLLYQRQVTCT